MNKQLTTAKIDIEKQGCQFLVSIDYDSDSADDAMKDTREPKKGTQKFYNILKVEPVFKK